MRIVNPTFGLSSATEEHVALKPINWKTDPIALFSNSKPNARELLEGIKAKLSAFRTVDNIDFVTKNSASQAASTELIQKISANYCAALLAIAD